MLHTTQPDLQLLERLSTMFPEVLCDFSTWPLLRCGVRAPFHRNVSHLQENVRVGSAKLYQKLQKLPVTVHVRGLVVPHTNKDFGSRPSWRHQLRQRTETTEQASNVRRRRRTLKVCRARARGPGMPKRHPLCLYLGGQMLRPKSAILNNPGVHPTGSRATKMFVGFKLRCMMQMLWRYA